MDRVFKIGFVFLVSFFILYPTTKTQAQKIPKKERKRLVKLAKRWYKSEEGLREYKELKDRLAGDRRTYIELIKEFDNNQKQIVSLNREAEQKEARIQELLAEIERLKAQQVEGYIPQKYNPCELVNGTVYKIQIVMPEEKLYRDLIDNQKQIIFSGERDEDGAYKYTIACFSNLGEAQSFQEEMKNLFIETVLATYENGQKVN